MFIVWGARATKKSLGYVADYCVFCHAQRAFQLTALRRKSHVMLVRVGPEKLTGHAARCLDCDVMMGVDARSYASVARRPIDDVDRLAAATFPDLSEFSNKERSLVRRVRNGEASFDERRSALERPFLILNPEVERRAQDMHIDLATVLAAVGTLFGGIGSHLVFAAVASKPDAELPPDPVTPWLVMAGIALTIGLLLTSGLRYRARVVYPKLAKALAPLQPSERDIDAVLTRLASLGYAIGDKLTAPKCYKPLRGE